MGECCAGSRCEQSDQQTCERVGGDYYPEGRGKCHLAGLLQEYIRERTDNDPLVTLATAGTFAELYDAVDLVLPKLGVGPRILEYYSELTPHMLPVLRANKDLFQAFYRVYLAGMIFVRQFVRISLDAPVMRVTYTKALQDDLHTVLEAFLTEVRERGEPVERFEQPFQFLEMLTGELVGMDVVQIFDRLRQSRETSAG